MSQYADIQAAIFQAQPVAFSGGTNVLHGEKSSYAISALCDFAALGIPATGYYVDTTQYTNKMQMKVVQTIFIDNSQNNGYVEVRNPLFNQAFALPAGYQGYFAILSSKISGGKFYITSTGNQKAIISFLNCAMPIAAWAATVQPPSVGLPQAVADAILDATVQNNRQNVTTLAGQITATDKSGTIVAANTSQILLPANPARQGFVVQNIDPAYPGEGLWVCPSGAAVVGGVGSFAVAACASIGYPGGMAQFAWSNEIQIVGATAGHKFSCVEW